MAASCLSGILIVNKIKAPRPKRVGDGQRELDDNIEHFPPDLSPRPSLMAKPPYGLAANCRFSVTFNFVHRVYNSYAVI